MNDAENKQETPIHAALRGELRYFAFWVVGLHMDTERSELQMGGFKEYLRRRFPLFAPFLIREIDRQLVLQAPEPTERRPDTGHGRNHEQSRS